jgi:hypothetical protein
VFKKDGFGRTLSNINGLPDGVRVLAISESVLLLENGDVYKIKYRDYSKKNFIKINGLPKPAIDIAGHTFSDCFVLLQDGTVWTVESDGSSVFQVGGATTKLKSHKHRSQSYMRNGFT